MRIAAYGQADLGGYFGGMTAGIAVRRWLDWPGPPGPAPLPWRSRGHLLVSRSSPFFLQA
jgi:hypothetical protein